MDPPQLVNFTNKHVTAMIDSPVSWTGMDRVRTVWGMDPPQLANFMRKHVATRIDSPVI